MKKSFIVLMLFFISSCSSSYTPSEKMLAYKKDMTIDQAKEILQKAVWGNETMSGICGSRGFWYDENADMHIEKSKITMLAHKRGKELKEKSQKFDDLVVFEKQYYQYEFEFSNINNIIIYDDPYLLPVFPVCNKKDIKTAYFIIDLFKDKLSNFKFIVM